MTFLVRDAYASPKERQRGGRPGRMGRQRERQRQRQREDKEILSMWVKETERARDRETAGLQKAYTADQRQKDTVRYL